VSKILDLTGKKFGRLTVLEVDTTSNSGKKKWLCTCECGKTISIIGSNLVSGNSKSCGCYKSEKLAKTHMEHGMTGTPTYRCWREMLRRCNDSRRFQYKNYGERGIAVCESRGDFKNFISDMGERPTALHSLDRIDNDRGYYKENCRWASNQQQNNNTRRNRRIDFLGRDMTFAEWGRALNLPKGIIGQRINRLGWDPIKALLTPPLNVRSNNG